jgi:hypothetical protein
VGICGVVHALMRHERLRSSFFERLFTRECLRTRHILSLDSDDRRRGFSFAVGNGRCFGILAFPRGLSEDSVDFFS